MMAPDSTNNSNDSSEVPKSPNPSTTSSNKSRKENCSSAEDDTQWRQLMDNHHQQCDLEKCKGMRSNGLYMCQFANIPGSIYSQYLRHKRRVNAYKTKPCRNFYGNGYCKASNKCPFYHNAEEQKQPPESEFDGLIMDNSGNLINTSMCSGIENMGMLEWNGNNNMGMMGNYLVANGGSGNPSTPILHHQQQQFFPNHQQQMQQQQIAIAVAAQHLCKLVDSLSTQIRPIQQKMTKHVCDTTNYFRAMSNNSNNNIAMHIMPNSNNNNAIKQQQSNSFSRAVGDNTKQQQIQMNGTSGNVRLDFDFGRSFHLFNDSYPLKNLPTDFSAPTATCSSTSATTTNDENENNDDEDPPTPLAADKYRA